MFESVSCRFSGILIVYVLDQLNADDVRQFIHMFFVYMKNEAVGNDVIYTYFPFACARGQSER